MMFLHTLRLAGDLSFYYAFAGFFAASFGGTPMPLVLVWPALCFGLASCFEGSRPLRTTLAALSAAALLFLPTGADKLCYFPAAVYPVLLAYTGDFTLSAGAAGRAPALALPGCGPSLQWQCCCGTPTRCFRRPCPLRRRQRCFWWGSTAPPGRTRRSPPGRAICCFPRRAGGGVCRAVPAQPAVLWLPVQRRLRPAVYFGGIVPVLQLFLNNIVVQGVTWLFHGILQFIHWLFTLFPPKPLERTEIVSTDEVIANAQKAAENAEPLINGMSMLTVLGILLAVLCAVLVVRHFLRQKFRHTDTACTDTTVRRSTHKRARRWPGLFLSPVDKVRREYAIYLTTASATA